MALRWGTTRVWTGSRFVWGVVLATKGDGNILVISGTRVKRVFEAY